MHALFMEIFKKYSKWLTDGVWRVPDPVSFCTTWYINTLICKNEHEKLRKGNVLTG